MAFICLMGGQAVAQQKTDHNFEVAKHLEVFNEVYKYLDLMYVDTLNAQEVVGTGISAMLKSLDPYTEYYPEDQVNRLRMLFTGKYVGIGAMVRFHTKLNTTVIDEPYEGNPAAEVGLKKGDIIVSIDDSVMTGREVSYVSSHLRGDPGTTFILKVKRPSTGKTISFKITRRAIDMPAVPYYGMCAPGIGYVALNSFTEGCAKDMRRAVMDLKGQGMEKLVLDLRNNGGGSLQEAIDIVNMFVPKGTLLVSTKGKIKTANREYVTRMEPIDTLMPVVVMVNDETASASEITSGSLQDLDRAVVIGTRTYGKGLVQQPLELSYNAQMRLTTSKYYIPSGRCIQAIRYKHSNGGSKEYIPDSLTSVFKTAHGRLVRDGGGIKPDMEVRPDSLPNIAYYLNASGADSTEVMFDYVVDYIANHPTIAPARDFKLTDQEYEQFKQRVTSSGFTYDPESERLLSTLKKIARFEGYYDDAKQEFEALEKKLKHDLARDLDKDSAVIRQMLEADIISAYYYQAGQIENALKHDKLCREACSLLQDEARYKEFLTPGNGQPEDKEKKTGK